LKIIAEVAALRKKKAAVVIKESALVIKTTKGAVAMITKMIGMTNLKKEKSAKGFFL